MKYDETDDDSIWNASASDEAYEYWVGDTRHTGDGLDLLSCIDGTEEAFGVLGRQLEEMQTIHKNIASICDKYNIVLCYSFTSGIPPEERTAPPCDDFIADWQSSSGVAC